MRFLFFGMQAVLSEHILRELLNAGHPPSAIWIPQASAQGHSSISRIRSDRVVSELDVIDPYLGNGILQTAWSGNIPIFGVRDLKAPATLRQLREMQADVAFIACFPWILPVELLSLPAYGTLNLHPSLLPAFRGPYPLFWQLHEGVSQSGITLHHVDEGLDTGDIALQQTLVMPNGISGTEAERLLAKAGAQLIGQALTMLETGGLPRIRQVGGGSYQSRPQAADFTIPTSWDAGRAFNFMRGTEEWRMPFLIEGDGFSLHARSAVAYQSTDIQELPLLSLGNEVLIQFAHGLLRVHR